MLNISLKQYLELVEDASTDVTMIQGQINDLERKKQTAVAPFDRQIVQLRQRLTSLNQQLMNQNKQTPQQQTPQPQVQPAPQNNVAGGTPAPAQR